MNPTVVRMISVFAVTTPITLDRVTLPSNAETFVAVEFRTDVADGPWVA